MNTNELETANKRLVNPGEFRTTAKANNGVTAAAKPPVRFTISNETGGSNNFWLGEGAGQEHGYMSERERMDDENDSTLDENMFQQSESNSTTAGSSDYFSTSNGPSQPVYEIKAHQLHYQQQQHQQYQHHQPHQGFTNKRQSSSQMQSQATHSNNNNNSSNNNFSLINSYCHSMPQLYPHVSAASNAQVGLLSNYFKPALIPHVPHHNNPASYHHVNSYASHLNNFYPPATQFSGGFAQNAQSMHHQSDSPNKENMGNVNNFMPMNGTTASNVFNDFRLSPFYFHNIETFAHFARVTLNVTDELIKDMVSNSKIQFWIDKNKTTGFIYQTLPKIENPKRRLPPVRCELCKFYGHLSHTCSIKELVFNLYNSVLKSGACRCHICGQLGHPAESGLCEYISCSFCKQLGHWNHMCPNIEKISRTLCHRCQRYGHSTDRCPDQWRQFDRISTFEQTPYQDPIHSKKPVYCYQCAKKGHYGHNCPDFYRKYFIRDNYQLNPVYFFAGSSPFVKSPVRLNDRDKRVIKLLVEKPLDVNFNPEKAEQDPLDELERRQAQLKTKNLLNSNSNGNGATSNYFQYQVPVSRYDESLSGLSSEGLHLKRFLRRWSTWIIDFHWVFTLKYLVEALPSPKLYTLIKSYPMLDNFIVHWMWWSHLLSKDLEAMTNDAFSGIGSMPWLFNDMRHEEQLQPPLLHLPQATSGGRRTTTSQGYYNTSAAAVSCSFVASGVPKRPSNDERLMPKKMKETVTSEEEEKQPTVVVVSSPEKQQQQPPLTQALLQPAERTSHSARRTRFLLTSRKGKEFESTSVRRLSETNRRLFSSLGKINSDDSSEDLKTVCELMERFSVKLNSRMEKCFDSGVRKLPTEPVAGYCDMDISNENETREEMEHDASESGDEDEANCSSVSKDNELENTVVYLNNEPTKSCSADDGLVHAETEANVAKTELFDEFVATTSEEPESMEASTSIEIDNQKSSAVSESMPCSVIEDTTSTVFTARSSSIVELNSIDPSGGGSGGCGQNIFDKLFKTSAANGYPDSSQSPSVDLDQQQQNQENLRKLLDLFKNAEKIVKNSDDESLIITTAAASATTAEPTPSSNNTSVDDFKFNIITSQHSSPEPPSNNSPQSIDNRASSTSDLLKLLLKIDTHRDSSSVTSVSATNSETVKGSILDRLLTCENVKVASAQEINEKGLSGFDDIGPLSVTTTDCDPSSQKPSIQPATSSQSIGIASLSSSTSSLSLYSVSPVGGRRLSPSSILDMSRSSNKTSVSSLLSPANTSNSSTAKPNADSSLSTSYSTTSSLSSSHDASHLSSGGGESGTSPTSYSLNKSKLLCTSSSMASSSSSLMSSSSIFSASSSKTGESSEQSKKSPKANETTEQGVTVTVTTLSSKTASVGSVSGGEMETTGGKSKPVSSNKQERSSNANSKFKNDHRFAKHANYHKSYPYHSTHSSHGGHHNNGFNGHRNNNSSGFAKKPTNVRSAHYNSSYLTARHSNYAAKTANQHLSTQAHMHGSGSTLDVQHNRTSSSHSSSRLADNGSSQMNKAATHNYLNNAVLQQTYAQSSGGGSDGVYHSYNDKNHQNIAPDSFSRQSSGAMSNLSSSVSTAQSSVHHHHHNHHSDAFYISINKNSVNSAMPASFGFAEGGGRGGYASFKNNNSQHNGVHSSLASSRVGRATAGSSSSNGGVSSFSRRLQSTNNDNVKFDSLAAAAAAARSGTDSPVASSSASSTFGSFAYNRKRRF